MSIQDYDLLADWREHHENPNVLVRADGAIKPKNAIRYNTSFGAEGACKAFSRDELDRMKQMVYGNIYTWR